MKKYIKRPIVIEAEQFKKGKRYPHIPELTYDPILRHEPFIDTCEGTMFVSEGDYIIRGIKGEVYPCKPDIFEATYDEVKDLDLSLLSDEEKEPIPE